jgi:hypothetical protein
LAYWQAQLAVGLGRDQVVQLIWESAEHRGLEVDEYYHTLLGRSADAAEKQFWVNSFLAGASAQDMVLGFLTATEYQSRYNGDSDYVDSLYSNLLGRSAGVAEEQYWLQASLDHSTIIQAFLDSDELFRQAVQGYNSAYFHRLGDMAGVNYWLSQPRSGRSLEAMGVGFLNATEFINAAF